jgi:hypothetical protein
MRRRSRAAVELDSAPVSHCSHCGRETRTVEGVCADCWVAKVPGAYEPMRRPPKTEPFFDWGSLGSGLGWWSLDGQLILGIIVLAVALVIGLVFGLR